MEIILFVKKLKSIPVPESVYIETTIPSLYVARRSASLVEAGRQRLTRIWWDEYRLEYDLVCSQTVLDECARGDPEMGAKRLELIASIPLLELTLETLALARVILDRGIVPEKASDDAIHIAVAAVHGIDYLLTWNCKHMANPRNWRRISACLAERGYRVPIICTPEEMTADDHR